MSPLPVAASGTFSVFAPPYDRLIPCGQEMIDELVEFETWKGTALVWQMTASPMARLEMAALRRKAPGLPLVVLLPPAAEIQSVAQELPHIRALQPRLVLPDGVVDSAYRLRQVFAIPPRAISAALTDYLIRRGVLKERRATREFQRIIELSADTPSVAALSRRMYTSRRTLGRHFIASGIPVPSHCLHFGRLLHVALHLQSEHGAMFRIASRFGYPDGFTMSNQMKRLIGYRPSEVRELLGWEWIVEAWLKKEGVA
jgi:AraC-like DNA-binding protein